MVREFQRRGRHQRTLAAISIAATPEYTDQLAARVCAYGAQNLTQRFRRMRVVDNDQWLGFTTTEAFDATRHRVRLLERRRGIDQRHATADQCTECRQQVVDIAAAEQAAADRSATQMTVEGQRKRTEEASVGKQRGKTS